jgi:AcrR family transcriptional regulator
MARPLRKDQHTNLQQAIRETAWKQIAEAGAPALSLGAVARALRITAPAIYNYFPSRDDLVTALIIEAYTSFGDSQLAARDALPAHDPVGRLRAIGLAYRDWALAHPQRYQLIFGTPIPGYHAPLMEVLPSAARSLSALVSVIDDLRRAGSLRADHFPGVMPGHETEFGLWKSHAGDYDILSLAVAMIVWSRVHGLVSLEIAGNLPPFGARGDALYVFELESIRRQFVREKK